MSRPGGPYRDERYPQQNQGHPQDGYQQGYPRRGHPDQGYQQGHDQGYQQGYGQSYGQGHDRGQSQGYDPGQRGYQPDYRQEHGQDHGRPAESYRPQQRPQERQRPAAPPDRERDGGGFRVPGLGLVLSLLGLVVQVLSLTVLPWVTADGDAEALPAVWDVLKDVDAAGFAGAYVVMFSYPLAVLGILLSLVAVLESVVMKVIWAILALIGVGALALRFGFGPVGDLIGGKPLEFSRQEITLGIVALAALVIVIFMLKMAMSTFRRLAGVVLLVIAGVHVAALNDFTGGEGLADLGLGAYGPALGYVLAAVAAFVGPPRIA